VLRFEPNTEQVVELWARWVILDDAKKTIRLKESYWTQPAKDKSTEASVAALSETVADLSREISSALREIGGAKNAEKTATRCSFSVEDRIDPLNLLLSDLLLEVFGSSLEREQRSARRPGATHRRDRIHCQEFVLYFKGIGGPKSVVA
jgi:ABC-type transport auxiliary lipoprotein component